MIVLNTTGSGVTPSTQTIQTNSAARSLFALGNGIGAYAEAVQFVHNQNPHVTTWLKLGTTPQQFSFNPNSNGEGTEFQCWRKPGC